MKIAVPVQTDEEEEPAPKEEVKVVPPKGTREWIQYWSEFEGHLPSPIDVSITGSFEYWCPQLKWLNFDVYPHKVKITNTGYTVLLGAKWRTERPYLEGGPFLEKHVLSQVHFHWGPDMMQGSEHTVDKRRYPGEMQVLILSTYIMPIYSNGWSMHLVNRVLAQRISIVIQRDNAARPSGHITKRQRVTFFRAEYLTQLEALKHPDGVVMICYMIKYGVNPDDRLDWVIEGFPRIQEAKSSTRVGPYPLSRLLPMFFEDYFLYWGNLSTKRGDNFAIRWLVPRTTLFASLEQMKEFRKLCDPWDEPNLGNSRPLQDREDRHVFFINRHWCQYNSLLPIPRVPEESISELSPAYQNHPWMLPSQNAYMLPEPEEENQVDNPKHN